MTFFSCLLAFTAFNVVSQVVRSSASLLCQNFRSFLITLVTQYFCHIVSVVKLRFASVLSFVFIEAQATSQGRLIIYSVST